MSLSQRCTNNNHRFESDTFADPFSTLVDRALTRLDSNLDLLHHAFSGSDRPSRMSNRLSSWTGDIRIDSSETKDAFLISADLPGVKKEDIKVSLNDRVLSIEAERKEDASGEDPEKNTYWKERTFGRVHRSFRLPRVANAEDYQCKFDNGVLDIRIGKKEPKSNVNYLSIN